MLQVQETYQLWDDVLRLMLSKNRVVVEGLGVFEAQYHHARIDPSSGKIAPPLKSFSFTASDLRDASLATLIANEQKLSPEDARQKLADAVSAFKSRLEKESSATIHPLGTFFLEGAEMG